MNLNTKGKSSHLSLVSEIQNLGMSCNLTDIILIEYFSLNIDSWKRNRNSVFSCHKCGITSTSLQREKQFDPLKCYYVPPPKGSPLQRGGGTYCFWCGSRWRRRSFLSARYLLNHWMDLDQTSTETSLGQPNRVIIFR